MVFNIVWTGTVFPYLRPFVASQIAQSEARFRFVANGCPATQVALMEEFREDHAGRVVEVLDVSPDAMIAHGVALDRVRAQRDDGPLFCLIDPDIKANAPFVSEFLALLDDHDAVTSGTEVWSDHNVIPENHPGVPGECFYDRNGFVFGSPHLALYRRAALDDTAERWGVGLGSAGPELRDDTKKQMAAMGHEYMVYDTAKITNALLQGDGHPLVHRDLPQLVHIGGLAHFLSPPAYRTNEQGEVEPDWTRYEVMAARHQVTRFCADTLRALGEGREPPLPPPGLEPGMATKLARVRHEIRDLVQRYAV